MAEVNSVTLSHRGTLTGTGLVTLSGGADDTINSGKLLSMCPTSGPLFDFLSATYANQAAAKAAFDLQFGIILIRPVTGDATLDYAAIWVASGPSVPSIQLVNAGVAGTFELTIMLMHSIIR
jgi:hypothetical protein